MADPAGGGLRDALDPRDRARTVPLMRAGTELLTDTLDAVEPGALAGPSLLPGWSRAHLAGHLARNAEALGRLLAWAATGVETPMYPGTTERDADIERSAGQPEPVLRAEVVATARDLDAAVDGLPEDRWSAPVRTASGRSIPAAEVPWMRVREVWVHAVDLDAGVGFGDLPAEVAGALLDDVVRMWARRPDPPALRLLSTDQPGEWRSGQPAAPPAGTVEVAGPLADLLAWATGRSAGTGLRPPGTLPTAPRWL